LTDTDRRLDEIATVEGTGSQARRNAQLSGLLASATADEQLFLRRLLLGELRQGALEGVMTDAVVAATQLPAAAVRRATMFAGDAAVVAERALLQGAEGLAGFDFELFRPLQPMLAQPAGGLDDALERIGNAVLDYKLDGARVQVHKRGDEVRVFTRQLNEVTASVPEITEAVSALPHASLALDGEAIAFDGDGRPQPFQVTMQRFGRRLNVDGLRRRIPLSVRFFDCLYRDGELLIDEPLTTRLQVLDDTIPGAMRVPRQSGSEADSTKCFLRQALADGHEGIMVKAADSSYLAGSRGADWLKIKPTHTLDLVVIAAEWGSGRRKGWLSNLHLAARDTHGGGFVMLGKTFKGLTDRLLKWQTEALLEREIRREGQVVHVRPELVVEIAFNELQTSHQYPGGMALRFARVKRYRTDKHANEADTLDTVRSLHEQGFAGVGE
jgi:DNA ligase-1